MQSFESCPVPLNVFVYIYSYLIWPEIDTHPPNTPPTRPLCSFSFSLSCTGLPLLRLGCLWPDRCRWFCFHLSEWTSGLSPEPLAGGVWGSVTCPPLASPFPGGEENIVYKWQKIHKFVEKAGKIHVLAVSGFSNHCVNTVNADVTMFLIWNIMKLQKLQCLTHARGAGTVMFV